MLRINDPQKHKVLCTLELYDVIINFQRVQTLLFLRIINSEQSLLSNYYTSIRYNNLNWKGLSFLIHTVERLHSALGFPLHHTSQVDVSTTMGIGGGKGK